jgi:hypothetical protein
MPVSKTLAELFRKPSRYLSALPERIARQAQSDVSVAAGMQDPNGYDNPTPYFAASEPNKAGAALSLAAMAQTGSMPFAPSGAGATLGAIPVWHGSPHKFDRFDMSKIGSGEGAQAYGHGLYFADKRAVADEYAGKLSDPIVSINGVDDFSGLSDAAKKAYGWLLQAAKSTQYGHKVGAVQNSLDNMVRHNKAIADELGYVDKFSTPIDIYDTGNLYKVSLEHPDTSIEAKNPLGPQHFLNYDAPLSEQSQYVLNAIGGERAHALLPGANIAPDDVLGSDFLRMLSQAGKKPIAEDMLRWQGIPGLRYLDAGSRGTAGTSNYVVFDDRIPKIIERNGVSLADLLKKR